MSAPARRLRVALDVRALEQAAANSASASGLGGIGRYSLGLLGALMDRDDPIDYSLLVRGGAAPAPVAELAARDNMQLVALTRGALRPLLDPRVLRRLPMLEGVLVDRRAASVRADVLHFLQQPAPSGRFRPALATIHDAFPLTTGDAAGRRLARSLRVDAAICVSDSVREQTQASLDGAAPRLVRVYPGIDTNVFRPGNGRVESPLGGRRYLLHVGVLRSRKNPEGLIAAFAQIARDDPDVDLACVGPYHVLPDDLANLRRLLDAHAVAHRAHILDAPKTDAELVDLYRCAEALVFPSAVEGFGFPILESLACGIPCVGSTRGAVPEIAGGLALLADPEDPAQIAAAARRAMDDHLLRERVLAEGPAWAARFDWATAAERIVSVWHELAVARRPG